MALCLLFAVNRFLLMPDKEVVGAYEYTFAILALLLLWLNLFRSMSKDLDKVLNEKNN